MKFFIATFTCIVIIILSFVFWGDRLEITMSQFLKSCTASPGKFIIFSFIFLASDIVLPVPSSIVMFLNGHVLGVYPGMLLSFVSVMVSAIIGYALGLYFAFRFTSSEGSKANRLLKKYGIYAIILSRGIPILSETFSFVCGYSRIEFKTFIIANMMGYIPVCFVYAYFGNLSKNTELFYIAFCGAIAIAALFALLGKIGYAPIKKDPAQL